MKHGVQHGPRYVHARTGWSVWTRVARPSLGSRREAQRAKGSFAFAVTKRLVGSAPLLRKYCMSIMLANTNQAWWPGLAFPDEGTQDPARRRQQAAQLSRIGIWTPEILEHLVQLQHLVHLNVQLENEDMTVVEAWRPDTKTAWNLRTTDLVLDVHWLVHLVKVRACSCVRTQLMANHSLRGDQGTLEIKTRPILPRVGRSPTRSVPGRTE